MAVTKQKKQEVVAELNDAIKGAEALAFVNFHGLTVGEVNELRSKLRVARVGYRVAKKTLIRRALTPFPFTGEIPALDGEIGLAWGDDPTAPAREVYEFQKTHKDKVELIGGVFEGAYQDKEGISEIARIPTLQVLRGMFVNIINSPIQGLVIALNQLADKRHT